MFPCHSSFITFILITSGSRAQYHTTSAKSRLFGKEKTTILLVAILCLVLTYFWSAWGAFHCLRRSDFSWFIFVWGWQDFIIKSFCFFFVLVCRSQFCLKYSLSHALFLLAFRIPYFCLLTNLFLYDILLEFNNRGAVIMISTGRAFWLVWERNCRRKPAFCPREHVWFVREYRTDCHLFLKVECY